MQTWFPTIVCPIAIASMLALLAPAQEPVPGRMAEKLFREKVAPLLRQSCLQCHNPAKSRGSLDLSTRAAALEGGEHGPALIAGDAKKSLLMQMIGGAKPRMPQKSAPLAANQVEEIGRWIDAGAPWPADVALGPKSDSGEKWWSLQALKQPVPPHPQDAAKWVRNAIDQFILATLQEKGLKPSAPADRATLIRRVTYDLTGLPPTVEEIDAFVKDAAPDAYEKLVDRLLASPRYAERWARLWLDLVHYADTHGYDKDKRRSWAWLYRDWVIRALHTDMPYRRFVQSQIAGDVLFPGDPDGIIATGFVVAGPWDFVGQVELREGTVDKEKTRVLDRDDMAASTISTFCSLTAHCARCHDHKFDPIPQKDYYRLQAVFAGVERGDRSVDAPESHKLRIAPAAKLKALSERHEKLRAAAAGDPALAKLDAQVGQWRALLQQLPPLPAGKRSATNGYHSGIVGRPDATKWVRVDLGQRVPLDEVVLVPARPVDFADTPGFGFPEMFRVELSDDPAFAKAETIADHTQSSLPNPGDRPVFVAAQGKTARYVRVTATRLWKRNGDYVFALAELQALAGGKNIASGAKVASADSIEGGLWSMRHLVDRFDSRRELPDLADAKVRQRFDLEANVAGAAHLREQTLDQLVRKADPELAVQVDAARTRIESLKDGKKVYAVLPIAPRPIHLLKRGDVEQKGVLVQPGALSLLPGLDGYFQQVKPGDEGSRRAALARWITDDANVLTWRSIANRIWQHHFGKGLVDTPNDFGRNGSRPTHPELLDWLACEFRGNGGSFKKLHKLILMSAAYRQSSQHNAAFAKIDGDNRYLWRMNRQRLDAESVRDGVLAISGKLDLKMFGPGYELFRFKDDHSPIYDHLDASKINDPATFRRTIYRFVVRSVPNPFLENLDCADPNLSVPVRNTTLTALQALTLLNNPFMVKQSEFFAERLRKQHAEPAQQVEAGYRLAFGRRPTAEERAAFVAYVERHGLANGCRVLLNANEFLFVD
jgi:hypothetical protein